MEKTYDDLYPMINNLLTVQSKRLIEHDDKSMWKEAQIPHNTPRTNWSFWQWLEIENHIQLMLERELIK